MKLAFLLCDLVATVVRPGHEHCIFTGQSDKMYWKKEWG